MKLGDFKNAASVDDDYIYDVNGNLTLDKNKSISSITYNHLKLRQDTNMIFNEHQSRLWSNMLNCIEDFRAGKVEYYDLVGSLEGALDAGDFQDKLLIEQWYEYWTPLEILRANEGNNINVENVNEYLRNMELFLKGKIL